MMKDDTAGMWTIDVVCEWYARPENISGERNQLEERVSVCCGGTLDVRHTEWKQIRRRSESQTGAPNAVVAEERIQRA